MADRAQLARQELARRELARRELSRRESGGVATEEKPQDSIATKGFSYVKEHPYKSFFDPTAKTITGKSLLERSQEAPIQGQPDRGVMNFFSGLERDIGAMGADIVTSPVTPVTFGLGALPPVKAAGEALAGTKPVQAFGRFLGKERHLGVPGRGIVRKFKAYRELPKIEESIKSERASVEALSAEKDLLTMGKRETSSTLGILKRKARQKYGEQLKLTKEESAKAIQDTAIALRENANTLKTNLSQAALDKSKLLKENLGEYFGNNSKGYGQFLDDIVDKAASSGEQIYASDVADMLYQTMSSADEALLTDGAGRQAINRLFETYRNKHALEPVDIKKFKQTMIDLKKMVSSSLKQGERFSREDIPIAILQNNWGKMLAQRTPELAKELNMLNQEYAPVIDAMKMSAKLFKPYGNIYDVKRGANFLEQFGMKGTTSAEDDFIKIIEEGSRFANGVGNITDDLVKLGNELKQARNSISPVLNSLKKTGKESVGKVEASLQRRMNQLAEREDFVKGTYLKKEMLIKEQITDYLKSIKVSTKRVSELMADRTQFELLLKSLGYLALSGGVGYAGVNVAEKLHRLGQ